MNAGISIAGKITSEGESLHKWDTLLNSSCSCRWPRRYSQRLSVGAPNRLARQKQPGRERAEQMGAILAQLTLADGSASDGASRFPNRAELGVQPRSAPMR